MGRLGNLGELQPGWVGMGWDAELDEHLPSESCQPCQALWASPPPLLPNCTVFEGWEGMTDRDDRPYCDSRVRVSLCQWGFQATSHPEKINKTLSDISITVGLKIILQHADSSGHAHVDVCMCLCRLTSAARQGSVLLGISSWEPRGTPGLPLLCAHQ